ncbi:MAG: hypothetical protein ABI543_08680 [Ignavibacteria bacterium]
MKTTLLKHLMLFALVAFVGILINSCGSDTITNNQGATTFLINGTVSFADTTRVYTGGSYNVSCFTTWPPAGAPSGIAIMTPVMIGGVYTSTYSISGLSNGKYFLASAWTKEPYVTGGNYVLGTNGCDTSSIFTCMPDTVTVSGNNVTDINFTSWIDTAKKLIKF